MADHVSWETANTRLDAWSVWVDRPARALEDPTAHVKDPTPGRALEGPDVTDPTPGRALEDLTADVKDPTPDEASESWHREWRQRFGCWWLALPPLTQTELGYCLGALSLHLGSKLEWIFPQQAPLAPVSAEPGCEWLEAASDELELPQFPAPFPAALGEGGSSGRGRWGRWEGWPYPPIPRLLPSWEVLQSYSPREGSAARVDALSLASAPAVGASVGLGAFAATAFFARRSSSKQRRRGGG